MNASFSEPRLDLMIPSDQLSSSQTFMLLIFAPLCFLACESTICLFLEYNSFTLITDLMGFLCFNILHFQVRAWVQPQYETTEGPLCEKACAFYKFETSFVVLLARLVRY